MSKTHNPGPSNTQLLCPLPPDVVNSIRAGTTISTVSKCVEELVLNSIDAKATNIQVSVNLDTFRIKVEDNGHGFTKEDLAVVGTKYMTSKCRTLADLDMLTQYGFRGEALASIILVSKMVEIKTSTGNAPSYWRKLKYGQDSAPVCKTSDLAKNSGCTVYVYGLLGSQPVRQNRIDKALELEEMKKTLELISLVNPCVGITLRNDITGAHLFRASASRSVSESFKQFTKPRHGPNPHQNIMEYNHHEGLFFIKGFVSMEGHVSRNLQLLYVNKRFAIKSKLLKLFNNNLNAVLGLKGTSSNSQSQSQGSRADQKYPVFLIAITCPCSEYDFINDEVKFKDMETLIKAAEGFSQVLKVYLLKKSQRENEKTRQIMAGNPRGDGISTALKANSGNSSSKSSSKNLAAFKESIGKEITVNDMKRAIQSKAVVRKRISKRPSTENLPDEPTTKHHKEEIYTSSDSEPEDKHNNNISTQHSERKNKIISQSLLSQLPSSCAGSSTSISSRDKYTQKSSLTNSSSKKTSIQPKKLSTYLKQKVPSQVDIIYHDHRKRRNPSEPNTAPTSLNRSIELSAGTKKPKMAIQGVLDSIWNLKSHSAVRHSQVSQAEDKRSNNSGSLNNSRDSLFKSSQNVEEDEKDDDDDNDRTPPFFRSSPISYSGAKSHSTSSSHHSENLRKQRENRTTSTTTTTTTTSDSTSTSYDANANKNRNYKTIQDDSSDDDYEMENEVGKLFRVSSRAYNNSCHPQTTTVEDIKWAFNKFNQQEMKIQQVSSPSSSSHDSSSRERNSSNRENIGDEIPWNKKKTPNASDVVRNLSFKSLGWTNNNDSSSSINNVISSYFKEEQKPEPLMRVIPITTTAPLQPLTNSQVSQIFFGITTPVPELKLPRTQSQNELYDMDDNTTVSVKKPFLKPFDYFGTINPGRSLLEVIQEDNEKKQKEKQEVGEYQWLLNNDEDNDQIMCSQNSNTATYTNQQQQSQEKMEEEGKEGVAPFIPSNSQDVDDVMEEDGYFEQVVKDSSFKHEVSVSPYFTDEKESKHTEQKQVEESSSLPQVPSTFGAPSIEQQKTNDDNSCLIRVNQPKSFRRTWLKNLMPETGKFFGKIETSGNGNKSSSNNDKLSIMGNINLATDDGTLISRTVRNVLMESGDDLIKSKWRNYNIGEIQPSISSLTEKSEFFFSEECWNVPKAPLELPILSLNAREVNLECSKMDNSRVSFRYSKEDLTRVQVIGNVDCKFISATIAVEGQSGLETVLVLFDQHAVHERILLEKHMNDSYAEMPNGEKRMASVTLNTPMIMHFTDFEVRILQAYGKEFQRLGTEFEILSTETVKMLAVPHCFVQKAEKEPLYNQMNIVRQLMDLLVHDEVQQIKETHGTLSTWPKAILEVLKSLACHGAYKFGDFLTLEESEGLIKDLKNCKTPFQCAHGRPVLVPLVYLDGP